MVMVLKMLILDGMILCFYERVGDLCEEAYAKEVPMCCGLKAVSWSATACLLQKKQTKPRD